ncbi:hypothetical protein HDE_01064 [Halotydeus destructor]|nr:hypothetical protein HDE_01064 [Halotydeus destructor]
MERLTVLYFFIATSLATEISDFDSICSHLVEKQGTSGNSLCRCNDATCHCDTDGHVSRIDPCWAVAYLSDTQRNNVSMTSRQSEGEIYSPVTYALIGHNRLLGFIAKNDEPLRHLKFTPSDPSALATTFSLYDASATGKRGMPTVLDYQMPGDFVTLRRDYTKIYFITHGVRESISHHDYKELSDLLIQHDRGCAVVHVNWNRGASINTFQAANYGFSLDDVTAVSNLVYGLPAVNAMVVGRELALVSYLLTFLQCCISRSHPLHRL